MSLLSPSLEAFWAVVQKGTVLEAAKMINLTQTGVTQRIRSLEKQLGVTLFTRSRKGMRLTNEGESLLRYVKAARDLEGETLSILNGETSPQVEIYISGPSTALKSRLMPKLAGVISKHPQLRVRLDFCDDGGVLGKLKSGRAHIGLISPHLVGSELASSPLEPQRYFLIGPTGWKKRKLEEILSQESIVNFEPLCGTTVNLIKKYKRSLKPQPLNHTVNNIEAALSLVKSGVGFSAMPHDLIQSHLKDGSLALLSREVFLDEPLSLAWYPRREMPPYLNDLLSAFTKKGTRAH